MARRLGFFVVMALFFASNVANGQYGYRSVYRSNQASWSPAIIHSRVYYPGHYFGPRTYYHSEPRRISGSFSQRRDHGVRLLAVPREENKRVNHVYRIKKGTQTREVNGVKQFLADYVHSYYGYSRDMEVAKYFGKTEGVGILGVARPVGSYPKHFVDEDKEGTHVWVPEYLYEKFIEKK